MLRDINFNHVNILIRVYETQLITAKQWHKILQANTPTKAYQLLAETSYAASIMQYDDVYDFEKMLELEKQKAYQKLYDMSPHRGLVDAFNIKYDYHNLKVLVKAKITNQDFSSLLQPLGSVNLQELRNIVNIQRSHVVPEQMLDAVKEVFTYVQEYQDTQGLDIIFDNYYWQHMQALATTIDNADFSLLLKRLIDLYNINTTFRSHILKRGRGFLLTVLVNGGSFSPSDIALAMADGVSSFCALWAETEYDALVTETYELYKITGTIKRFALKCDNFLTAYYQDRKIQPFGADAMLGFMLAKEAESKNIRLVLVGKINHLDNQIIQERMRDIYV